MPPTFVSTRDKAEINVRFEIVKFALDDQKNVGIASYFEAFLGSITQIFTSQIGHLFRPHPKVREPKTIFS
jgi:hypothetical protein